jgi:hypothetical protein
LRAQVQDAVDARLRESHLGIHDDMLDVEPVPGPPTAACAGVRNALTRLRDLLVEAVSEAVTVAYDTAHGIGDSTHSPGTASAPVTSVASAIDKAMTTAAEKLVLRVRELRDDLKAGRVLGTLSCAYVAVLCEIVCARVDTKKVAQVVEEVCVSVLLNV